MVSIVILCYKAERGVYPYVQRVQESISSVTDDWELILVGNYHAGSDDKTPDIVREIATTDSRIKAITFEKDGMMGWDARKGLEAATGDILIFIDGDSQMPAEDVLSVYKLIQDQNCDLAMTYRCVRHDGLLRRANSKLYNSIFNILFPGTGVVDVNSKPKALRRSFYDRIVLTSNDWFLDAEIVILARRLGVKIAQIPTVFHRSPDRKSFVCPGAIFEFLRNLLYARFKEFLTKK